MDYELQAQADELIRALGALGAAQERDPHSQDVSALTDQAEELQRTLELSDLRP